MSEGTRPMTRREIREAAQRAAAASAAARAAARIAGGAALDSVGAAGGVVPEASSPEPVAAVPSSLSSATRSPIPTRRSLHAPRMEPIPPEVPTLVRPPAAAATRGLDANGALASLEFTGESSATAIPVVSPVIPVSPAPLASLGSTSTLTPAIPTFESIITGSKAEAVVPVVPAPSPAPMPSPALALPPALSPALAVGAPDDGDVDGAFDIPSAFTPSISVAAIPAEPALPFDPEVGRLTALPHREDAYTWVHYLILGVVAFVLGWLLWQFLDDTPDHIPTASSTTDVGALSVAASAHGEL